MEQEKEISSDGLECKYTIKGKGKAILLIHGFGFTGSSWTHIEKGLQDSYKLITPTLPGFGGTQLVKPLTIELLANLLSKILEKEQINDVVILGHSMGGYIALEMISKYPHIEKGLGLIHSHPFADDHSKIRNRKKSIDFINKYGSYRYSKETIPHLFDKDFRKVNNVIVRQLIEEAGTASESTFTTYLSAIKDRKDQSEVLKRSKKPVLFILGEEDQSLPLELGLQQVTLPDTAFLKILFDTGHLGIFEKPEDVISEIKKYLDYLSY